MKDFSAARPKLADVTLIAVTSVAVGATVNALRASLRQVDFAEAILLSDQKPPEGIEREIRWRPIRRLESRADYSRFMLQDLAEHIATSHALCVQWDGFVLNGSAWKADFLNYDYIGAVWPQFSDDYNVGNGGFSLRSRRLLEATRNLPFDGLEAEDIVVARLCRARLEREGIRFAPESVAYQFAYERTRPSGQEFGFHGSFNLIRQVPAQEALALFRSLEAGMLTRKEKFELLWWALTHARPRLAWALLGRLGIAP